MQVINEQLQPTRGKKHWSVVGVRVFQPASNLLTGDRNVVRISNDFLPRERCSTLKSASRVRQTVTKEVLRKNMETNKHYIAFLDILGFKDLIENNKLDDIIKLYEKFEPTLLFSMALTNLEWRKNNLDTSELPGIDNMPLNSLMISDSILIWTDSDDGKEFLQLLNTVKYHFGTLCTLK